MEGRKIEEELDALRLAVARLEAEVQGLRGAAARASATMANGGDDRRAGYDPWIRSYCEGGADKELMYEFKIKRLGHKIGIHVGERALLIDGAYIDAGAGLEVNADDGNYRNALTSDAGTYLYLNIASTANGYAVSYGDRDGTARWSICIGIYDTYQQLMPWEGHAINYVMGALILNSAAGSGSTTVDLVTNVEYSESTRKLTQTKKTVTVANATDPVNATTDVFQATPHSNEHQAN